MSRHLGLHLKLQLTRLDWSGLRPMARQAAARGRLCAGAAGPGPVARDALYGVGCGLPSGRLPVVLPVATFLITKIGAQSVVAWNKRMLVYRGFA